METYTVIYLNKELNHYGVIEVKETGINPSIRTAKESLAPILGCSFEDVLIYQVYGKKELPLWESANCPLDLQRL